MRPREPEGPGAWWQMPQGGIDASEDPAKAALRELEEETGIRSVEIIAESPGWYTYDLPASCGPRPGAGAIAGRGRSGSRRASRAPRRRSRWCAPGHPGVRRLALGRHRRAGRPHRALQARRLRAGGARLRRPRPAATPALTSLTAISRAARAVWRDKSRKSLNIALLADLPHGVPHRNAGRETPRPSLSPLRRDHADQPRRSGLGGPAAAEVGGGRIGLHLADARRACRSARTCAYLISAGPTALDVPFTSCAPLSARSSLSGSVERGGAGADQIGARRLESGRFWARRRADVPDAVARDCAATPRVALCRPVAAQSRATASAPSARRRACRSARTRACVRLSDQRRPHRARRPVQRAARWKWRGVR